MSEQIEIYKYKIKGDNDEDLDNRYHHVPEHLASEFQESVNSLGKKWELLANKTYHQDKEEYETKPENQGRLYRAKLIKKGLKAYGTAVAVAHVDGIQDQVIASAAYVAAKTSELAKEQKVDDKRLQATETLVNNLIGKVDNFIANVQDEKGQPNAFANKLVAETKTQRNHLDTKLKELNSEPQTVGAATSGKAGSK